MTKSNHDRFKDAPWFTTQKPPVMIGGAGGIGSWLTALLSRAGFECHVFDFDVYETHNMGGQFLVKQAIGKPKVDALQELIRNFSDEEIQVYNEPYTEESMTNDIMFSGFDNMAARHIYFKRWLQYNEDNPNAIFIDGRLTAEQLTIFCVKGADYPAIDLFQRKYLYPDSNVPDAPCTFKQTSHTAAMIAAHMVTFFTNFYAKVLGKDDARTVPFRWELFTALDVTDVIYEVEKNNPSPVTTAAPEPANVDLVDVKVEATSDVLDGLPF